MIRAFIPSYTCVEISGRNKRYHTYRIEVHHHEDIFYVDRRYSDFLHLHKELRRKFGNETPGFPPKRVRNNTVKVLESRRSSLEQYLQIMLQFNPIPKEVLGFLNLHHSHFNTSDDQSFSSSAFVVESIHHTTEIANPAAGFVEDPFIESDTSSNISDTVTRGVIDALYNL